MSYPQSAPLPYIWTTWISKLLAGENSCEWAAWRKANYGKVATKNDADFEKWRRKHTNLLRRARSEFESQECQVLTEDQNWFKLAGKNAALGGKPDLISIGEQFMICDVKSGQPKSSDRVQVMIYMYAVPRAMPQYKGKKFDGLVFYEDDQELIRADAIDETFISDLSSLIKRISSNMPAQRVPSFRECMMCDIPKDICEDKIDHTEAQGVTDDF